MCQKLVTHPGYARLNCFKLLKAQDGNFLIGHYISIKEKDNELIKRVMDTLWKENDQEKRTIDELVKIAEKKNKVSILIEEQTHKQEKFAIPKPRKMYIFITKKVA